MSASPIPLIDLAAFSSASPAERARVVQESMADVQVALQTGELQSVERSGIEKLIEKRIENYQTATLREAKRRCSRAEKKLRDHLLKFNWDRIYNDVRSDGVTCG